MTDSADMAGSPALAAPAADARPAAAAAAAVSEEEPASIAAGEEEAYGPSPLTTTAEIALKPPDAHPPQTGAFDASLELSLKDGEGGTLGNARSG